MTGVQTCALPISWTILLLRRYNWALESPVAEIMIACYASFMIFSGLFTGLSYGWAKAKNYLMKLCLIVNGLYAVAGIIFLALMLNTYFT